MAIPTVGRGRADLLAPFGAEGRFARLTVEQVELFQGDDSIWRDFERDRDAAYGARWAAFSRASVLPNWRRISTAIRRAGKASWHGWRPAWPGGWRRTRSRRSFPLGMLVIAK